MAADPAAHLGATAPDPAAGEVDGIRYSSADRLTVAVFTEVLVASTLGARRPVDEPERIARMLEGDGVVLVTAWEGDLLVGVSRTLTDFAFAAYLSDLAVRASHQRRGIGRHLIAASHAAVGRHLRLLLTAAPAAVDYYPHIGMQRHESAWFLPPVTP